jgi:hypothetical protein
MALLKSTVYHTNPLFDVDHKHKEMVTEASTLGIPAGHPTATQLYDDACDVGIVLRSHTTNKLAHWYLEEEEAVDGDLLLWKFKPVYETLREQPQLEGWTLIVLND